MRAHAFLWIEAFVSKYLRRRARSSPTRLRDSHISNCRAEPLPQLAGEGGAIGRRKTPVIRRAMAPDGVRPTASAQVGLRDCQREPSSDQPCFPHPIRPSGPPSPLCGEGGARRDRLVAGADRAASGRVPSPRKAGRRGREAPDEGLRRPFRKSPRRPSPRPSPRIGRPQGRPSVDGLCGARGVPAQPSVSPRSASAAARAAGSR